MPDYSSLLTDPLRFQALCWPKVRFYDKQVEIIQSVVENDETFVPAGNMLGKDFVAGFICLWYFLSHNPCRIITTSVKDDHLRVLWGEIGRFIQSSRLPLSKEKGGPLIVNHRDIRKILRGEEDKISYLRGMVSEKGEGMAGHHAAHTLLVIDEASGVDDAVYNQGDTWARKKLIIGNPNPCSQFFFKGVREGDLKSDVEGRYYRKIWKVRAVDSPNVRLALRQKEKGIKPTGEILLPGVLTWDDYQKRLATWDDVRRSVGLDAEFYLGAEVLLYPPIWLDRAADAAIELVGKKRVAKSLGIDAAEGGDATVWTVIDELGIIEQISKRTQDTSVITGDTIALINRYGLDSRDVLFDRGGGGKQHADRLRTQGYNVRTVGFGEAATDPHVYNRFKTRSERQETIENRYQYKNRRAEMYGLLRELLDPSYPFELNGSFITTFGIPAELTELRRQLAPLPLKYDGEGRMYLPPKDKPTVNYTGQTIKDILGRSPDESDSLVLAVFSMIVKQLRPVVGAIT